MSRPLPSPLFPYTTLFRSGRHTVLACWKVSAGQSLLTPLQDSATSHTPAAARHTAVLLASAGQSLLTPLQDSATSHTPAAARHTAVLLASAAQSGLLPVQY